MTTDRIPARRARARIAASLGVALLASSPATSEPPPQGAPAPDSPAWRGVQLARWQAFYEGSLEPPQDRPTIELPTGMPDDEPQPPPPLRPKYDRTSAASGMDLLVSTEFAKLRAALPHAEARALSRWTVVVKRCTSTGPALLTTVDVTRRELCVAPILVASLFFASSGDDMARLTRQLRRYGVDPATFSGAYEDRLSRQGVTRADWTSALSAFSEPAWSRLRRSVDVVVARGMLCGVLARPRPVCGVDAYRLARRVDPSGEAGSLVAALRSATSGYEPASWGYESAGDGEAALAQISSLRP